MKYKTFLFALYVAAAALIVFGIAYLVRSVRHAPIKPTAQVREDDRQEGRHLALFSEAWTGDFDQMLENRRIRILVPHSRTLDFNDRAGSGA